MRELNKYQLQVLARGAFEEREGVQVHTYPANETEDLLKQYYDWRHNDQTCDIEVVVEALLDLYDFWACYFAAGAETAFKIKQIEDKERLQAINEQIARWQEDSDKRLEAEVERYGC